MRKSQPSRQKCQQANINFLHSLNLDIHLVWHYLQYLVEHILFLAEGAAHDEHVPSHNALFCLAEKPDNRMA